jgi:hypothetical protein
MRQLQTGRRHGIALMFVIVVLMICSALLVSVTTQIVAAHRMLERRERQQQSLWLARSGLELAASHLLHDSKYRGETGDLIPLGQARITVEVDKKAANIFTITSEARFPTDLREAVVRSLTRQYRRAVSGSTVRLEAIP